MHLIKTNTTKNFKYSKKKIFLIVLFFAVISCVLFFAIKPKNKETDFNNIQYEEIIKKINAKENLDLIKIEKFIIENQNIYGTLTSLLLAKEYISQNNLDKAFIQLQTSLKYTKEENLKNILRIRMSKIKIEQNKYEDAMQIIQKIKDDSWNNIVENMKGDIFIKNKDFESAIRSWNNSKNFEESTTNKEIINMKINEVNTAS